MSDLEQMKAMFTQAGVKFTELSDHPMYAHTIQIDNGEGYTGFYAEFHFDEEGAFAFHGVWE